MNLFALYDKLMFRSFTKFIVLSCPHFLQPIPLVCEYATCSNSPCLGHIIITSHVL